MHDNSEPIISEVIVKLMNENGELIIDRWRLSKWSCTLSIYSI